MSQEQQRYDFAVIGAGIVGLATARALQQRFPAASVLVLDKEAGVARHQTGRNSGVIHSGIYYPPGSLKARLAMAGGAALVDFCRAHDIAHEVCGKLIVATSEGELPRLEALYARGLAHGLAVERIDRGRLRDFEPHATGLAAIHVPATGIVDYRQVAATLARLVAEAGGEVQLGAAVEAMAARDEVVVIEDGARSWRARWLINCAGLHSDRVARLAGARPGCRIVPFRGEYYELKPERRHLVRNLIYPVPDPRFPFLGVHFTRGIDGGVHAGPNAVLAPGREAYRNRDASLRDCVEMALYPGLWRLAARYWRAGLGEMRRSFSKGAFVAGLQHLIPEVLADDLVPAPSGIRAQALLPDGGLADDFLIVPGPRAVHVLNAPSPAATAGLEIGRAVADMVAARYDGA